MRSGSMPDRGDAVEAARARRQAADLGPLFDVPVPPMATHDDYATSRAAADAVAPITGALRLQVLAVIRATPKITDPELERLPQFAQYAASTVRKRRSELLKMGELRADGARDGASCWVAVQP